MILSCRDGILFFFSVMVYFGSFGGKYRSDIWKTIQAEGFFIRSHALNSLRVFGLYSKNDDKRKTNQICLNGLC